MEPPAVSLDLHLRRVIAGLKPRREPYWGAPIATGQALGFRRIDDKTGTWIARIQNAPDSGASSRYSYKALGLDAGGFGFEEAKAAAVHWFKNRDAGVTDDVLTVADACREYVTDRKREKGVATARDAEARFE